VSDPDEGDGQDLPSYPADQAVLADTIAPKPAERTGEQLTERVRIVAVLKLLQKFQNLPPLGVSEGGDLAFGLARQLDPPALLRQDLVQADPLSTFCERGLREEHIFQIFYVNLKRPLGVICLRTAGLFGEARQALIEPFGDTDHRMTTRSVPVPIHAAILYRFVLQM
jgi:hypothetical protein